MQIKVIATGSSKFERSIRRWGVSFLIGDDLIFDAFGDPGVFFNNIQKFNINTAKIKHIILSHDDWDHIAGLWSLIDNREYITVYVCHGFKQGIKDKIVSTGVKLIEVEGMMQIKDSIYSTGQLYGESEGRKIYEQSVVIKTTYGLAVICGCAHPGVVNIVRQTKENLQTSVYSLIGGFHLKDNADEINMSVIKEIQKLGIRKIGPMHCTGERATEAMRKLFGQGFMRIKEGDSLQV